MFTNISAVLFDIDGTLLDTSEYIIQAFEHTLAQEGFSADREAIRNLVGLPLSECYARLTGADAVTIERMTAERFVFQNNNLNLVTPFQGTAHTLNQLREAGYQVAACSTRSKNTVPATLAYAGLLDYFDTIICPEDTTHHKPHPEPLLKALESISVTPARAVMVGDSVVDIQAGKNAGTQTVRATYGINTDHLHNPEPDAFIDSIEALLPLLP